MGVLDDNGTGTVMVGVIDGQGDVMVIIWTDCDDVAVGLHGTVTVLIPWTEDANEPDNGGAILECSIGVLA